MPDTTPLTPDEALLLQRRMAALNDGDLVLPDWDLTFVQSICARKPETLTDRQRAMVERLCWRHRAQLPSGIAPTAEPKMPPKPERRWADEHVRPRHRRRGIAALPALGIPA